MTSSIPNGFSTDDLERMLKEASSEAGESAETEAGSPSQRMIKLAGKLCDDMMDLEGGPLLHKVVALTILARLASWHKTVGRDRLQDNDDCGESWLMDAGKCEAASELLVSIDLGDDDFTCHDLTEE